MDMTLSNYDIIVVEFFLPETVTSFKGLIKLYLGRSYTEYEILLSRLYKSTAVWFGLLEDR